MNTLPVCLLFGLIAKPRKKKILQTFPLYNEVDSEEIYNFRHFDEYFKVFLNPEKRIYLNEADRMIILEEINKNAYNFLSNIKKNTNDNDRQSILHELHQLVNNTIESYYKFLPTNYLFSQNISFLSLTNPLLNDQVSSKCFVYFSLYINDYIEVKNSCKHRAILNNYTSPFPITLDLVELFDPRIVTTENLFLDPSLRKLYNYLPFHSHKIEHYYPWANQQLLISLGNIYGQIHEDNLKILPADYIDQKLNELEPLVQKYTSYSTDSDSFKEKLNKYRSKHNLTLSLSASVKKKRNICNEILNYSLVLKDCVPFDKSEIFHIKDSTKLSNSIPSLAFPYSYVLPKTISEFYKGLMHDALESKLIQTDEPSIYHLLSRKNQKLLRYAHLLTSSESELQKLSNPLDSTKLGDQESDNISFSKNIKLIQHRDPVSNKMLPFVGDGKLSTTKELCELFGAHNVRKKNLKRPRDELIAPRIQESQDYNIKTHDDAPSPELLCLIKDIMASKLSISPYNLTDTKRFKENKSLFNQAFDETALIALAVIVEELISAQLEYWRSQGSFLPFSMQYLKSEFIAQLSGSESQLPYSKSIESSIQSILEVLFDRDLSSFIHHFEEWAEELSPPNISSEKIHEEYIPDPDWTLNRPSASTLPHAKRLRPSSQLPQYLQDAKEEYNFLISPLYMDLDHFSNS